MRHYRLLLVASLIGIVSVLVPCVIGGLQNKSLLDSLEYEFVFEGDSIAWGENSSLFGTAYVIAWRDEPSSSLVNGSSIIWEPVIDWAALDPKESPVGVWVDYAAGARRHVVVAECSGFPWRCCYARLRLAENKIDVSHGIVIPKKDTRPLNPGFIIPYKIRFLFFALNFIVCSSFWVVILLSLSTYARMYREKRGRCVDCNYDLKNGHCDYCPECGRRKAS